jgi:hypothetical protein
MTKLINQSKGESAHTHWQSDGELVTTAKGEGFYCVDTVHAQFAVRKHQETAAQRDELLAAANLVADRLHRAANGAGTVTGITLGQIKTLARECRDDLRAAIKHAE